MITIQLQLADVTKRIADAVARASRQEAHVRALTEKGLDAADARALLSMMASALKQMQDVEQLLQAHRQWPRP